MKNLNSPIFTSRKLLLFTLVAGLSACGSQDSDDALPEPSPTPTAPIVVVPQPAGLQGKSSESTIDEQTNAGLLDDDNDGLINQIDQQPQTPLSVWDTDKALSINYVTDTDEQPHRDNILIVGQTVYGQLENYQDHTGPFYLVFHHSEGKHGIEITPDDKGMFAAQTGEILPTGISVATQYGVSQPLKVKAYLPNEPVLFASDNAMLLGDTISLEGRNLAAIEQLRFDGLPIDFEFDNQTITFRLPKQASTSTLEITSSNKTDYLPLALEREVSVLADQSISEANQWSTLNHSGVKVLSAQHDSVSQLALLRLPVTGKIEIVKFYHPQLRTLEAVVWPNSEHIVAGTQSTLESRVVRKLDGALQATELTTIQALLSNILASDVGQASVNNLSELHSQALSPQAEALLNQEADHFITLIGQNNAAIRSHLLQRSAPTPIEGTEGVFDYFNDTFTAIFAGNVMYEPISTVNSQQATHGANHYAGMKVSLYRDATTCVGIESLNIPAGIWPSDLCARNEAVYFASLQVTNALTNKILRSHSKQYIDNNMIGASGWGLLSLDNIAYLTTDSGSPLCHMQACELEIITGGFGLFTNVSLTKAEEDIYEIVMGRTVLERAVLPALGEVLGLVNVSGDTGKCLATFIATSAPTSVVSYGIMIAEFKKKIDAASSPEEIVGISSETLGKYAYDIATQMLATKKFPDCLPAAFKESMIASLNDKVGDAAEKVNVPFRIANLVTAAFQGYQAITAPRKFVFEVAPRAAITRVSTSNSSENVPELYSTVDSDKLFIRGTKFVYLQEDNTNFWPKLRLTDRFGNKQTLQLNDSHKVDIADFSWVDIGIPVTDLAPLMEKLSGEIITVSIIMDDQDYPEFSSEGLILPGRNIRWVGQPKLSSVTPRNARAGRLITLQGENLQSFTSRSDLKLKVIQANDETRTAEILQIESYTDNQIKFRLPSSMPTNLYKLRLETSDSSLYLNVPDDVSQGSDTGAISVIPQSSSLVQLYDAGAKIDDGIIIYIANADGDLISQNNEFVKLELLENNRLPAVTMWWINQGLSAQNGGSTVPGMVNITCDTGGNDGICTYRVKGEINVDGTFKAIEHRGKLKTHDTVSYRF